MAKQQISLREANQHLSRYVAQVEKGSEILITRRGIPVARLTGVARQQRVSREQRQALARLRASARPLHIGRIRREDVYDRFDR